MLNGFLNTFAGLDPYNFEYHSYLTPGVALEIYPTHTFDAKVAYYGLAFVSSLNNDEWGIFILNGMGDYESESGSSIFTPKFLCGNGDLFFIDHCSLNSKIVQEEQGDYAVPCWIWTYGNSQRVDVFWFLQEE